MQWRHGLKISLLIAQRNVVKVLINYVTYWRYKVVWKHVIMTSNKLLGARVEMEFILKSSTSQNEAVFSNLEPEYVTVAISGNVSASVRACTYTDERGLLNFFSKLAVFKKPWKVPVKWKTLEDQFSITATCDALGNVSFELTLQDNFGHPEPWFVQITLTSELGAMAHLKQEADAFFK